MSMTTLGASGTLKLIEIGAIGARGKPGQWELGYRSTSRFGAQARGPARFELVEEPSAELLKTSECRSRLHRRSVVGDNPLLGAMHNSHEPVSCWLGANSLTRERAAEQVQVLN
jgi:hypothetical protein